MPKQLQKSSFSTLKIKENDLDMITGGAAVVTSIDGTCLKTDCTQQCNCGKFTPHTLGVSLNICDNCKYAQAPYDGAPTIYCSVQHPSNS